MESQFDLEPDREGRKAVPAERSAEMPDALRVASQIGNQAVQRVATSRSLQRSPAAAGLVRGRVIARQADDEEIGNENAAAEPAANDNAAAEPEAASNENASETTPEPTENAAEPAEALPEEEAA